MGAAGETGLCAENREDRVTARGALGHMDRGPLAAHQLGACLRPAAELRGSVSLEGCLLELIEFRELASSHLFNQLLNGLGGGLTYLYELHGRRIVRLIGRQNPLLVAVSSLPSGHIGDGARC